MYDICMLWIYNMFVIYTHTRNLGTQIIQKHRSTNSGIYMYTFSYPTEVHFRRCVLNIISDTFRAACTKKPYSYPTCTNVCLLGNTASVTYAIRLFFFTCLQTDGCV